MKYAKTHKNGARHQRADVHHAFLRERSTLGKTKITSPHIPMNLPPSLVQIDSSIERKKYLTNGHDGPVMHFHGYTGQNLKKR